MYVNVTLELHAQHVLTLSFKGSERLPRVRGRDGGHPQPVYSWYGELVAEPS